MDVVEKFVLGVFYRDNKGLFSWEKELHLTIKKVYAHERKRDRPIVGRLTLHMNNYESRRAVVAYGMSVDEQPHLVRIIA